MLLVFGEVLFDCFKDEKLLGGAPFNLVNHLKLHGESPLLFSAVGDDVDGEAIVTFMSGNSLNNRLVQIVKGKKTGRVNVVLNHKDDPEYDILEDVAFDYIKWNPIIESLFAQEVDFFYYGTLAQRHEISAETLTRCLEYCRKRDIHTLCDLNLRKPFYDKKMIDYSLANCVDLKISDEELSELAGLYETEDIVDFLFEKNNRLERVWITKGEKGAECITRSEGIFSSPSVQIEKLVSAVGAGDSFTSVIIHGLRQDESIDTLLQQAVKYAATICQKKGAF